jgi:sec-independent protein translocase protein TatC
MDSEDIVPKNTEEKELTEIVEPSAMTLWEHLDEMRGILFRCLGFVMVMGIVLMVFIKPVADWLNWPLRQAFSDNPPVLAHQGLITTSPLGVFSVMMQILLLGSLSLSLPFCLWQVARFVKPALKPRELKMIRPVIFAAIVLFTLGASFAFFILTPAALKASIYLNAMFGYQVLWSADRYYSLLLWMVIGLGITFEFPIVIVGMNYAGVISREQLIDFRAYSIVVFLVIAAIVTPTTDPVTFLLMAFPMSLLYELSIIATRFTQKDA